MLHAAHGLSTKQVQYKVHTQFLEVENSELEWASEHLSKLSRSH